MAAFGAAFGVRFVAADAPMHQPDAGAVIRRTAVKGDPLNQGTGTIADANDCDANFAHA